MSYLTGFIGFSVFYGQFLSSDLPLPVLLHSVPASASQFLLLLLILSSSQHLHLSPHLCHLYFCLWRCSCSSSVCLFLWFSFVLFNDYLCCRSSLRRHACVWVHMLLSPCDKMIIKEHFQGLCYPNGNLLLQDSTEITGHLLNER